MKSLDPKISVDNLHVDGQKATVEKAWEAFLVCGTRSAYAYRGGPNTRESIRIVTIIDKIARCVDKIELQDAEFDMLRDCVDKANWDSSLCKIVARCTAKYDEMIA